MFDLFQQEFLSSEATYIKLRIEVSNDESPTLFKFILTMDHGEKEWAVSFVPEQKSISCSCQKFETFGILCRHALKVLRIMEVKSMPEQYILKRWTKEARSGPLLEVVGTMAVGDVQFASTERYKEICPQLIRLAIEASRSEEAILILRKAIVELGKQIMEVNNNQISQESIAMDNMSQSLLAKGFKKKEGTKSSKRMKSWVENQSKKKGNDSRVTTSHQVQSSTLITVTDAINDQVHARVPTPIAPTNSSIAFNQPSQENNSTLSQLSFTGLLNQIECPSQL